MVSSPKIGLVIPFYQRQAGLLTACLASVVTQANFQDCHVVVVDDGSPISARAEMESLLANYANIQLVEQVNGGPSAARNKGLDSLPEGIEIVTFLDSDDAWSPGYLESVLEAFEYGCDVYFANSVRYSSNETRFEWGHASGRRLVVTEHEAIDSSNMLHVFRGDFFDFVLDRSAIIGPSTFAYSYLRHRDVRFQRELRWGEDRYFKLEVIKNAKIVIFTNKISAVEGRGVNIFDNAQWGSVQGLDLLVAYLQMTRKILKEIPLSTDQRGLVTDQLKKYRSDFALTVAHLFRSGVMTPRSVWRRAARVDPGALIFFIPMLAQALVTRLTGGSR